MIRPAPAGPSVRRNHLASLGFGAAGSAWLGLAALAGPACGGDPAGTATEPTAAQEQRDTDLVQPGPRPVDEFHPATLAGEAQPRPAYGGRIIVHLESMPENINRAVENSAVTREMHHTCHEALAHQDWESWEYVPRLARSWDTEDLVALSPAAAERFRAWPVADGSVDLVTTVEIAVPRAELDAARAEAEASGGDPDAVPRLREVDALFGQLAESGDGFTLAGVSTGNPIGEYGPIELSAEDVTQVERGTVFTMNLRDDVIWHPGGGIEGHTFDAGDAVFSWSVYQNPDVDCDEVRFQFVKLTRADVVDRFTARFFYEQQYFAAIGSLGVDMMILPAHLYDLSDPDNPAYDAETAPGGPNHDPDAFARRQAEWINETPFNGEQFVGLGPYRVTTYDQQYIEFTRFEDYFDPAIGGHFDVIRYRMIDDDDTAWQALVNQELDFFYRVKSSYYFGPQTESELFKQEFYKGYYYLGNYGFTAWNMYRPGLEERDVRVALAMAFDNQEYLQTNYRGLARQVTGPFPYSSLAYDHSIPAVPYDPDEAMLLLEDAGWYDRDGNGIVDKDGVDLELDFLMPSGNDASKTLGEKMQSSFAEIGVKLNIVQLEWATFIDKLKSRDFDGGNLAWMPALESDPEQVWHSRWGGLDTQSSNFSGFRNATADALIEKGQRELDKDKRQEIWRQLHKVVYDEMPYLFGYNVPRKFAMNQKIRGFKSYPIRPGFSVRDWYYPEGTPGTRPGPTAASAPADGGR